jgi:hypothetical protein
METTKIAVFKGRSESDSVKKRFELSEEGYYDIRAV